MQNTDLFEGDIVGISADASSRRLHDDVEDVARIFGQPVSSVAEGSLISDISVPQFPKCRYLC